MRPAILTLLTALALTSDARVRAVRHPSPDGVVHYRGDAERSGVYRTNGPRTFSRVAWQAAVAAGSFSAPVQAFGKLFAPSGNGRLAALDAATGVVLWTSQSMGSFTSSPTIAPDAVYVSGEDRRIYALHPATGATLWSYLADDWGIGAPLVSNEVVYFGTEAGSMIALDITTRTQRWRFSAGAPIHANVVLSRGNLFLWAGPTIYALNATTGQELWRRTREGFWFDVVFSDGVLLAIHSDLAIRALNAADGSERWSVAAPAGVTIWNHPAVSHGVVCLTNDTQVVALDALTGTRRWSYTTPAGPAEPAIADGVVYVGANRRVVALDVVSGLELFSTTVAATVDRGAAIGDGRLFVVTANGIVSALE